MTTELVRGTEALTRTLTTSMSATAKGTCTERATANPKQPVSVLSAGTDRYRRYP